MQYWDRQAPGLLEQTRKRPQLLDGELSAPQGRRVPTHLRRWAWLPDCVGCNSRSTGWSSICVQAAAKKGINGSLKKTDSCRTCPWCTRDQQPLVKCTYWAADHRKLLVVVFECNGEDRLKAHEQTNTEKWFTIRFFAKGRDGSLTSTFEAQDLKSFSAWLQQLGQCLWDLVNSKTKVLAIVQYDLQEHHARICS